MSSQPKNPYPERISFILENGLRLFTLMAIILPTIGFIALLPYGFQVGVFPSTQALIGLPLIYVFTVGFLICVGFSAVIFSPLVPFYNFFPERVYCVAPTSIQIVLAIHLPATMVLCASNYCSVSSVGILFACFGALQFILSPIILKTKLHRCYFGPEKAFCWKLFLSLLVGSLLAFISQGLLIFLFQFYGDFTKISLPLLALSALISILSNVLILSMRRFFQKVAFIICLVIAFLYFKAPTISEALWKITGLGAIPNANLVIRKEGEIYLRAAKWVKYSSDPSEPDLINVGPVSVLMLLGDELVISEARVKVSKDRYFSNDWVISNKKTPAKLRLNSNLLLDLKPIDKKSLTE